jgi:hypothetical protein
MHPLVRSNGRRFDHSGLAARHQEGFEKPKQHRPKLKIVLKVSNQYGAHLVVSRPFLTDRTAMLRHHVVRSTSTSQRRPSLT